MKYIILVTALFLCLELRGQEIVSIDPIKVGKKLNFSPEFINNFNSKESFEACEKVWKKMSAESRSWQEATDSEKDILKYCDEVRENVWDIIGGGCSWYCGGGVRSVTASSSLSSQGSNNYDPNNAHDFSFKNAWVEGVSGYGIGESLTYSFVPENPRITQIIVVNGYVKSERAWKSNSRVKKLRVYHNNEVLADLNLKDVRAEQHFEFQPIGYSNRDDFDILKKKDPWILKFEILEVYKGDKYDDTAITEIYFDGIDVH